MDILEPQTPPVESAASPKRNLKAARTGIVFVLIFVVGFTLGAQRNTAAATPWDLLKSQFTTTGNTGSVDLGPLWQAWSLLEDKYVATAERPSNEEKVFGLVRGLAESYNDPYTTFLDPEELKLFSDSVEGGTFTGVGMEVGIKAEGLLQVVAPLKDTPAYKAGIKAGDYILQIDNTSTQGMSVDEAVMLIRGEEGTTVTLTLGREGVREPLVKEVVRAEIEVPVLRTEEKDGVFIIHLYTFSADIGTRFKEAIAEYERSKAQGLVLDLRNNPGGYLNSAVDIASWFTEAGAVVVREQSSAEADSERTYRSKGFSSAKLDRYPVTILVNEGSASASEIVAGALDDYNRARIMGETTFGKGSVQELISLVDGTALKITTARWLTPEGRSISEGGLVPDVIVVDDLATEADEQLAEAIAYIKSSR